MLYLQYLETFGLFELSETSDWLITFTVKARVCLRLQFYIKIK